MKSDKKVTSIKEAQAARFLAAALELVESKGIREWATSEANHGVWLKLARDWLDEIKPAVKWLGVTQRPDEALRFSTYIVCVYLDGPRKSGLKSLTSLTS
jgi:hypothetical protein